MLSEYTSSQQLMIGAISLWLIFGFLGWIIFVKYEKRLTYITVRDLFSLLVGLVLGGVTLGVMLIEYWNEIPTPKILASILDYKIWSK